MDFGKLDSIKEVDFSLPPDNKVTKEFLANLKPNKTPLHLYVGCAKWGRKDWIGKLYPKGTKEKDFLGKYTQQFNCIELNAMFYNLQPKKIIEGWASLADKNFRFCPKYTQSISHLHQLKNADKSTEQFMDHMLSFGDKLGHCFLQLSDRFAPNRADVLQKYLQQLPRDFKTCVELRHPDWFKESAVVKETFAMFHELGIGTVITDTAGRRDILHMKLTAPVAFIRYVGNDLDPTDFVRINSWVKRIKSWMDKGLKEIYFFIHTHEEKNSPELGKYAVDQFNKKCGTDLKAPILGDGGPTLF